MYASRQTTAWTLDGTLRGTFTIQAEGQSDSNIRSIFTRGFQSQWRATMERQLLAVSPKARLLSVDYGRNPKDYQAAPIQIIFRYEIPDYAMQGEKEMLFKPLVMNNLYNQVRSYLRIDTRNEGTASMVLKMPAPVWWNWMKRFSLPAGYRLVSAAKGGYHAGSGSRF